MESIQIKCAYAEIECKHYDSSGCSLLTDCRECEMNKTIEVEGSKFIRKERTNTKGIVPLCEECFFIDQFPCPALKDGN